MNKKRLSKMLTVTTLLGGFSAVAGAVVPACSPPEILCAAAFGEFAVVLDLEETSDKDSQCAAMNYDIIYFETYASPRADLTADWSKAKVAARSELMGLLEEDSKFYGVSDETNQNYAFGTFTNPKPDASDLCYLNFDEPAVLELDEIPFGATPPEEGANGTKEDKGFFASLFGSDDKSAGPRGMMGEEDQTQTTTSDTTLVAEPEADTSATDSSTSTSADDTSVGTGDTTGVTSEPTATGEPPYEGQDAQDMKISYSDVKIVVSADAQGTQMSGTMKIEWNGCDATYKMRGVYPVSWCETTEDCQHKDSRINPSFDVMCDTDSELCTLVNDKLPVYEEIVKL